MGFSNKLYELRKQRGLSQEELAGRLNVTRQTVSKWELGDSSPDMEKLMAISDLFGVSLDELVMDKAPEPAPPQTTTTAGTEIYTDIKEHVFTEGNRKRAKKGLKIAAIALGVLVLIDIISFIVYVAIFGLPG